MKQQLALEWFTQQLETFLKLHGNEWEKFYDLYSQAKVMEKEQISKAHYDGYYREDLYDTRNYYNDTFKK